MKSMGKIHATWICFPENPATINVLNTFRMYVCTVLVVADFCGNPKSSTFLNRYKQSPIYQVAGALFLNRYKQSTIYQVEGALFDHHFIDRLCVYFSTQNSFSSPTSSSMIFWVTWKSVGVKQASYVRKLTHKFMSRLS